MTERERKSILMAANVYLTDTLSSVSSVNSAVREVVWGLVQVIACKTSHDDSGKHNVDHHEEQSSETTMKTSDTQHEGENVRKEGKDEKKINEDNKEEEEEEEEEEELIVEMQLKDLPLSFGKPKNVHNKKKKKLGSHQVSNNHNDSSISRSTEIQKISHRLPRSKHHKFLEQNILMGYYKEDGNWYPCRVLGNSHIGKRHIHPSLHERI